MHRELAHEHQLLETLPVGVCVHVQGRIVYTNAALARMVRVASADSALGRPILDFVHPDYHARTQERVESIYEKKQAADLSEIADGKVSFDADKLRDNFGALVEQIIRSVGIPVQFGGGFRSRDAVERWIDKGAGRIVIGTMAAHDPDLLRELAKRYPDQIVLAVDVFQGSVMTEGWKIRSALEPETYVKAFDDAPLAGIIVTDIDSDIEETDGSLGLITGLAAQTRHPVIARGTVRTVDDVSRLKYVPNIAGTIIGRALLSKDVDLGEALRLARAEPEPIAEFR